MGADRTETPTVDAQALFDVALDAIISITPEGRIVQFNASAERTFGHRREDVVGRRLSELIIPPHLREAHERGIARIAAGGPSTLAGGRLELPALRADGHELLVELTITPPQRETGVITAFLRDVTELRRTETALRVSEQDLRQIFDQAPTGMALVGVHEATMGTLLKVNAAMCALVGRDESELLGTHIAAVTHPDDVATFTAVLADTLAGNRSGYEVEKRFVRPDGTAVWAQINATLVRDAAGAPSHVIGLVQDV
jgi:PAS domain S-box-containing protein